MSAIAALSLLVAGCDGPRGVTGADSFAATQTAASVTDKATYRLALGDKVKVTVFNEPDLSGEFQVNDSGNITLPLAGDVPAAGKSIIEFRAAATRTLSRGFAKNPRVAVEVSNYRPFNVIGEVKNAGQYPYRPGLTTQDAVAMAGGYTYRADTHTLYVKRAESGGERTIKTDEQAANVLPGDNIRIPERFF